MSEEKLRILKMVESGVISADEAVKLIEALEKGSAISSEKETRSSAEKEEESSKGFNLGGLFEELEKFGQKMAGQRPTTETVTQSKDKLFEFMQSAVKRLKDVEMPFVGKGTEFTHVFHEQNVTPRRLKLETANGSVTVRPWDGEGVKAECHVKVFGVSTEEEAKQSFLKNSIFYAREDKLSLSVGLKLMKTDITLFIPSKELDDVSVKLFNGAFDMRDVEAEKLEVRSGNGKIELKNSHIAVIEAETGNGPIRLIDCEGERAELNTFNGAIHMVGTYRFADLQTFNGNLLYDAKRDQAEAVRAESMTGNIELYVPQDLAVKGEIRTTAGRLTLPETGMGHVSEKDERIQKSLKFESENVMGDRQLMIDAETKTGSITLRMSSLRQTPSPGSDEDSFGDGI
ncbi:DUF4097 domain-containing protein [Domibacillus sp. DTU_2020_1001157_1_SI_ALB_TIR_016]|uniref:DUF4097 family beta strand repeat-containing protein n=1 Tax=Domibacillus sp. DTU_2020_1001157_1_SI_ALB_TIR_016 TaxID=3077789 RepID=UPI0028EFFEF5|nr:DUF4097 domain-containing protein [Domibacillus sp. DTU_2020_1001157_1_SI_ALB_TIR_016]WNS81348.1 DUF4097 domain-containing protein [Domibacillus sp. DTU_2020_1001157_1_SI_ALB_TIR_016]